MTGISRSSRHKRSASGAQRAHYRKKRKFELGRQPANTKLGAKRIHSVRTRGGNTKYRALRLDTGNFAWGSESITRKTRIIGVVSTLLFERLPARQASKAIFMNTSLYPRALFDSRIDHVCRFTTPLTTSLSEPTRSSRAPSFRWMQLPSANGTRRTYVVLFLTTVPRALTLSFLSVRPARDQEGCEEGGRC